MNSAGDKLLPGSCFSGDQNRRLPGTDEPCKSIDLFHALAVTEHSWKRLEARLRLFNFRQ